MQLRVARLCLDCEELYVGNCCPVCASERSAFLSNWLPSEERRRWRRPAAKARHSSSSLFQSWRRRLHQWFGDEEMESTGPALRTRAADHVPNLDFENRAPEPKDDAPTTQEPAKVPGSSRH